MSGDRFGTESLRERVLAAWVATPARFREDANAEEDFARTAYRDRLVVELAQNAADAAARAGVAGRLLLRVEGDVLYAANVGSRLDAAGVEALSHLRVSAKGPEAVGRYGVGFKSVLAVSDEPAVVCRDGGVRWSAAETRRLVSAVATPALAAELSRREGHVPVMRLPFPAEPDPVAAALLDAGFDTVVVLPLRDAAAVATTGDLLRDFDPTSLLFLPGLTEVTVGGRAIGVRRDGPRVRLEAAGDAGDWLVRTASGRFDAALLRDRPVEERERPAWTVGWAFRIGPDGLPVRHSGDRRLRAPQPTDEAVDLPAVLLLSAPLDSSRRHVVPGPVTDRLVAAAARLFADVLTELPGVPRLLDLLPEGFPAGPVDLALREALADVLPRARLFAAAGDPAHRLSAGEAAGLDCGAASEAVTALLAPLLPSLVAPEWVVGHRRAAAAALGVRVLEPADVVDLLHGVDRPPAWWGAMYAALAVASDRDALRALPVPLADGRIVTGPRDLLLPSDPDLLRAASDAGLPLRWVHPDAATDGASDLLRALGARDPDAPTLLDDLREAVERSLDDDPPVDPTGLADVVLRLLARHPGLADGRPWLGELALPDATGELRAAGELLLPESAGGRLAGIVDPDSPFGIVAAEVVERYGAAALEAVGVLATFAVVRDADVPVDPEVTDHWLDGEAEWLDELLDLVGEPAAPPVVAELAAVRDLEWVRADPVAWAAAWSELAELRAEIVEPVAVLLPAGGRLLVPSYTAWWLRRHECVPVAGGLARPVAAATPEAAGALRAAAGLAGRAAELAVAVGVYAGGPPTAAHVAWLVEALPAADVDLATVRAAYAELAAARDLDVAPPDLVRAVADGRAVTVPAAAACVVDLPDLLPLLGDRAVVPAPLCASGRLAALLGVPLASEVVDGRVESRPVGERPWPVALADLLAPSAAALGPSYVEHDPLRCAGQRLPWRVVDGIAHVDRAAGPAAVARAAAWLAGRWAARDTLAAYLVAGPSDRPRLHAEALLDDV